jgi:energy-coupling factor transporter ATP-binding protein EcfA2
MAKAKAAPAARHEIVLKKSVQKASADAKLRQQIAHVLGRLLAGGRDRLGWSASAEYEGPADDFGGKVYTCTVTLANSNARRPAESLARDVAQMAKVAAAAGRAHKWLLDSVDGAPQSPGGSEPAPAVPVAQAELPAEWRDAFSHLYERDDQIELVAAAVLQAIDSEFHNRFHVALIGPPAGGKSDIAHTFTRVLGEHAVLEFDATSTTQAGAIKNLDERSEVPPFLVVEEIEKAEENSLRWLLSVLDHRGEIRKTTFRGDIHRETKMFCIATVNDFERFAGMMSGALASRFPNKVWCPPPGRSILQRILEREVAKVRGKKSWVRPALDYCEAHNIWDPREAVSICLCGRDELLTGQYQARLDRCTRHDFHAEAPKA